MATKNLSKMSVKELEALSYELDEKKQAIREDQRDVQAALEAANAKIAAARTAETMSDPEKAALVQHVKAEGIKSAEASGTPG